MILKLEFKGIDTFNQPIFKNVDKKSFYGTNDVLFSRYATKEEVINKINDLNIRLVYFGSFFDCEPEGIRLKEEVKIEFI